MGKEPFFFPTQYLTSHRNPKSNPIIIVIYNNLISDYVQRLDGYFVMKFQWIQKLIVTAILN